MFKYSLLLLTLIAFVGCIKDPSLVKKNNGVLPESPTTINDEFDKEILISNLTLENNTVQNPYNNLINQIEFNVIEVKSYVQRISIKNDTSTTQNLVITTTGDDFSVLLNRCKSTLEAGRSCTVDVQYSPRRVYNNSYFGNLNIAGNSPIPMVAVVNISQNTEVDDQSDFNSLFIYSNDGYNSYIIGSNPIRYVYLKNPTLKKVKNINFIFPTAQYSVFANQCRDELPANSTCRITLYFKNFRENALPTLAGSDVIATNGTVSKMVNIFKPFDYLATYSDYSPLAPILNPCDGTTVGTRAVTSCKRSDTNQFISNSLCIDPNPTINYPSPAGERSTIVFGGTKIDTCNLGSNIVSSYRYECNTDYFSNGEMCLFNTRGSFAEIKNQYFKSSGGYSLLYNVDQSTIESKSNDMKVIYLIQF